MIAYDVRVEGSSNVGYCIHKILKSETPQQLVTLSIMQRMEQGSLRNSSTFSLDKIAKIATISGATIVSCLLYTSVLNYHGDAQPVREAYASCVGRLAKHKKRREPLHVPGSFVPQVWQACSLAAGKVPLQLVAAEATPVGKRVGLCDVNCPLATHVGILAARSGKSWVLSELEESRLRDAQGRRLPPAFL